MKIVYLARISLPLSKEMILNEGLGGSESALTYSARALARLGHDVGVVHPGSEDFSLDNARFIAQSSLTNALIEQADLVISFRDIDLLGTELCRGRPVVLWLHDDYSRFWYDYKQIAAWRPLLQGFSGRIFTISHWQKQRLQQMFGNSLAENKFFVTRNGIPFEFEAEPAPDKEPGRLIYTSVLNRGFDFMPAIMRELKRALPDLKLYVCTSYPQEYQLYARNDPAIVFLGKLNRPELRAALCRSQLLVYPSHPAPFNIGRFGVFAETCSLACLEAQACSVPVVTSARGGLNETVLDRQTGLLVSGDPLSNADYVPRFAEAVVSLLRAPATLQEYGRQGRRLVMERYRWETVVKEWLSVFEQL